MSRAVYVVIVVVIIIIIAAGGLYALTLPNSSSSSTTSIASTSSITSSSMTSSLGSSSSSSSIGSTSSSSPSSSTFTSSSSSSSTQTTSANVPSTLVLDSWQWASPSDNQLNAAYELPFPDWQELTVYQPLFTLNETAEYSTGAIQYMPGLVANWTVSANGETWTFNLRHNVTFSNGDAFNAYQVWLQMYGFYYLNGNSSGFLESYTFFNISKVVFGPATLAMIQSNGGAVHPSQQVQNLMMNSSWPIYVTNPYQIVFQLTTPFQWLPGILIAYEGLIFDAQYVIDNGGFGTPGTINPNFTNNPIPGTGPYKVTQIVQDGYMSFTQNPTYWGKSLTPAQLAVQPLFDPGHVKNVIINYKPDDLARYTDLSSGAAPIAVIQTQDWPLVTQNPDKYGYVVTPPNADVTFAITLNTAKYPTNITDVRLAIVHGINNSEIEQKAFFGLFSPFVGPEYRAWPQFYDLGNYPAYSYNVTLAKQYLAQANVTNMPALTFTVLSGCAPCLTTAEVVQSDLSLIGITVNIQLLLNYYSVYIGSYAGDLANVNQEGQLTELEGIAVVPCCITPADNWLSTVNNQSIYGNWAVYSNPIVQQAVNAFTSTSNISLIQSLVAKAQAQIYKDAPYSWLGEPQLFQWGGSTVWLKSVIKGFYADPTWGGQNDMPLLNTITFVGQ